MNHGVVIVGGGLAAQRCAEGLRRSGFEDSVRIVCDEHARPYDRPPLSKGALAENVSQESLAFRPAAWYEENDVELLLGRAALSLDPRARAVTLADGSRVRYEQLLIATGARPRQLPIFAGYRNVSSLRTGEDARRLREALTPGARLLIVGAGFIGQEAACAALDAGASATIVEAAPTPLAALLGEPLGRWFAQLHRSQGAQLYLSDGIGAVHGRESVESVTLASGATIECDHVLVGVGVEPSLDWLGECSLPRDGVRTDADGRSALAHVYAAGDAAARLDPLLGRHVLGGHWESAARGGARAAKAMLGLDPGPSTPASFWSDLYGTRIQYLGHAALADRVSLDGNLELGDFAATFTRAGRPVAVLLADRPDQLPHARALLSASNTERIAA